MMGFWDAVTSAGSYANNLHLASDRKPHNSVFTGWMHFLTPSSVKALKAIRLKAVITRLALQTKKKQQTKN